MKADGGKKYTLFTTEKNAQELCWSLFLDPIGEVLQERLRLLDQDGCGCWIRYYRIGCGCWIRGDLEAACMSAIPFLCLQVSVY